LNTNDISKNKLMDIVYLILFHKGPDQLFRLIDSLKGPSVFFVIHVCRNFKEFDQLKERAEFYDNLKFCERERGSWASYGVVKATLNGLQTAVSETDEFGHLVLLSAQDYPLKCNRAILDFFRAHRGKSFISAAPCEPEGLSNQQKYLDPVKGYWTDRDGGNRYKFFRLKLFRNTYLRLHSEPSKKTDLKSRVRFLVRHWVVKLLGERQFFPGLEPYFGAQWCVLTRQHCKFVLEEYPKEHAFHRYMKKVYCPDEMFFHTILYNSTHRPQVNNRRLHYYRWEEPTHPLVLGSKDLDEIREANANGDYLFVRKLDMSRDPKVFDLIDERLRRDTSMALRRDAANFTSSKPGFYKKIL